MTLINFNTRNSCTTTIINDIGFKALELWGIRTVIKTIALLVKHGLYKTMSSSAINAFSSEAMTEWVAENAPGIIPNVIKKSVAKQLSIDASEELGEDTLIKMAAKYFFKQGILKFPLVGGLKSLFSKISAGKSIVTEEAAVADTENPMGDFIEDSATSAEGTDAAVTAAETTAAETTAEGAEGATALADATDATAALAGGEGGVNPLADAAALVLLTVQSILLVVTIDFAMQDVVMHGFGEYAGCIGLYSSDNNKTSCVNGYLGEDGCEPCDQIDSMRDYENSDTYRRSYQNLTDITAENRYKSYVADGPKDPSAVHKLTSLICEEPVKNKKGPTYADRPFPGGYCFRQLRTTENSDDLIDSDSDVASTEIYKDPDNSYLTNNPAMCQPGTIYKMPNSADFESSFTPAGSFVANLTQAEENYIWNFCPLDWAGDPNAPAGSCNLEVSEEENCSNYFSCAWNYSSWMGRKYHGGTDYLDRWTDTDSTLKPPVAPQDLDNMTTRVGADVWRDDSFFIPPNLTGAIDSKYSPDSRTRKGQLSDDEMINNDSVFLVSEDNPGGPRKIGRPLIHQYDNSNVCLDNYELAGDTMYFRKDNREYDIEVKNKENQTFTSNYCCPEIINGQKCPRWKDGLVIDNETGTDEFNGYKEPGLDPNTANCYKIDKPEFISEKYHNKNIHDDWNSNPDFKTVRAGSIQCGRFSTKSDGDDSYNQNDHVDYETKSVNNTINPVKTASDSNYHGTRFKLDSRYPFFSEYDSGATGYQNYLDPYDFVPLKMRTSEGQLSKYITNEKITPEHFKIKHKETTISDVIANELGHNDRKNLYCDNIECNDLEKTKYMQTVYDTFCIKKGNSVSSPYIPNTYNKFYRTAWINDNIPQDKRSTGSELDPQYKEQYSDICCDPISFSRKTSFVGCDADGKNPYFLDQIIRDYSENQVVDLPDTSEGKPRVRINPIEGEKQNLNQCIPSMETKCNLSSKFFENTPDADQTRTLNEMSGNCSHLLDSIGLNDYNKGDNSLDLDFNKSLYNICKEYSDGTCNLALPEHIYNELTFYDKINNDGQYWLNHRLTTGYAPYKSWKDNPPSEWATNPSLIPEARSDFTINPPDYNDVYNKCVPIEPCSNVYDLEIYDKNIDVLENNRNYPYPSPSQDFPRESKCDVNNNYQTIRYSKKDGISAPNAETLMQPDNLYINIHCRNYEYSDMNTYSNKPFVTGPFDEGNDVFYNIGCISSPQLENNKIVMNLY